jgi:beta-glucuronidase
MSRLRTRVLSLCLGFALLAPGPARGQEPPAAPPKPVELDDGWSFRPDPADQGMAQGLWRGDNAGGFRGIGVPHVFDARPLPRLFGGSVGWYRLSFTAPGATGMAWAFRFEQVRRVARVWLNGVPLGSHSDPYVPFSLPARGLRPGERNTLVMRVDSRKAKEPREGWWNWGGITRSVRLVPLGRVALSDVGLMPQVSCTDGRCSARVLVDAQLTNRTSATISPRVAVTLRREGSAVSARGVPIGPLAPGARVPVRFSVRIAGRPRLWAPDHPFLYDAKVDAIAGTRVEHSESRRVGLRSVTVRRGRLHLNGRPLALHGASIQEDVPGRGAALREEDMAEIVEQLKAVGANVTRAHYLLSDRLLELFDEAGIMVWNQAPIYHRDRLLRTAAQRERALVTVRKTVVGARSHPSVIVHSVANELSVIPDRVPSIGRFLRDAAAVARRADPTVPIALDLLSYPGFPAQQAYRRFDALGINNYFGWYPGKRDHPTGRLADLEPFLRTTHARYPRQALVMTEFGAEATRGGPADVKQTYAFQKRYIEQTLGVVNRLPFMGGAIYWTLREFAVKPYWNGGALTRTDGPDSIHNKALITYAGKRKPAWEATQAIFSSLPTYLPRPGARPAPPAPSSLASVPLALVLLALFAGLVAFDLWCYRGIRAAAQLARVPRRRALPAQADGAPMEPVERVPPRTASRSARVVRSYERGEGRPVEVERSPWDSSTRGTD